jgi:antitoxin component YwqK of YwqJK toxin-antitoxin module
MIHIRLKYWFWVILIHGILFVSCNKGTKLVIEEKFDDGKTKTAKYYQNQDRAQILIKEIQYYSNGKKKLEGEFEENIKDGKWIFYYENGEIWSQGFFKKGLRTGKTLVYHENGQIFYEGEYSEGQKHGVWNFYNQEGKLANTVEFDAGKIVNQTFEKKQPKDSAFIE